jgi:hypothetical protein
MIHPIHRRFGGATVSPGLYESQSVHQQRQRNAVVIMLWFPQDQYGTKAAAGDLTWCTK